MRAVTKAAVALAAGAMSLTLAGAAQATTVLSDNFDGENGGFTGFNYTGFSNFNVNSGTVDIVRSGDYSVDCAGGAGSCVDLDGTSAGGELRTKVAYDFNAGDIVTLYFQISGNQRDSNFDDFYAGFSFVGTGNLSSYGYGGAWGAFAFGPAGISGFSVGTSTNSESFQSYSVTFTAASGGSAYAFVGGGGADSVGAVLDNVSLDISPSSGTPEPGAWALMLLGFGALGTALRRRRAYA